MALTINTNMASLVVQDNLNKATKSLNSSIERMTTGYKINAAGDDAAGYSVATNFATKLSSTNVAESNVQIGSSMLSTLEKNYDLVISHFQRIRDLTEEAANGTYSTESINAIKAEVEARWDEIDRIANITEFNGIKLMDGSKNTGVTLQIGIDSSQHSQLALAGNLFSKATASALSGVTKAAFTAYFTPGGTNYGTALDKIDGALSSVTSKQTAIGASQNRLDSALDALVTQYDNISSSLSTVRDADVAKESSNFIRAQILQQASASLLATANQAPSIAINLV